MRSEPREEDLNVNIVLRSGITTGDDKGKQSEEGFIMLLQRNMNLIWSA